MPARKFSVGDKFTVDPALYPASCHGVVYVVAKVPRGASGVNYTGVPENGGRGVRAPEYAMREYDPSNPPAAPAAAPFTPIPEIASLVRVHYHPSIDPDDLYVVTGYPQRSTDAVRLVLLGGNEGRYWKAIPVALLEVIDPARVKVGDA